MVAGMGLMRQDIEKVEGRIGKLEQSRYCVLG
jgi:hypothetical protein